NGWTFRRWAGTPSPGYLATLYRRACPTCASLRADLGQARDRCLVTLAQERSSPGTRVTPCPGRASAGLPARAKIRDPGPHDGRERLQVAQIDDRSAYVTRTSKTSGRAAGRRASATSSARALSAALCASPRRGAPCSARHAWPSPPCARECPPA